ncbi:15014_t:CDS:2, partial [Entrophospora sp. SA101]
DIFGDDGEELSDVMDSYSEFGSDVLDGSDNDYFDKSNLMKSKKKQKYLLKVMLALVVVDNKICTTKKTEQKGKTQLKDHDIDKINENEEVIPKNHELVLLLESRKIVDQDFAEFLPKRQSSKKSKEKYINLDVLNDYEAANLYKVMFQADDNDVKGIASKQPCIKKPDLLEDAVAQLSKTYLAEALLECNILVAIKHLLEPLPETIRQLATQLVEKWSRSILGLSDDYREVAPTLSRK